MSIGFSLYLNFGTVLHPQCSPQISNHPTCNTPKPPPPNLFFATSLSLSTLPKIQRFLLQSSTIIFKVFRKPRLFCTMEFTSNLSPNVLEIGMFFDPKRKHLLKIRLFLKEIQFRQSDSSSDKRSLD